MASNQKIAPENEFIVNQTLDLIVKSEELELLERPET
jgi:hypothetical protein